ncbi:hypothetical protein DJ82_04875 [Halorubrum sp. Ib24]|uniref:response regulator n=1 Tax=unclassified Halorubrum TaxID=2642239 RepID=UPI000B99C06B|nr:MULTISPECIES: response regulator [unclassified Halorubrum]OYR41492.1 hypothetical protein DJ82_04875 [Halorubrum sp. Ib24]OYR46106.1 hypothetical protein DJ81_03350 [Halorubrum sp. Hd13]OYR48901.1 hypothetical protein DJ75_02125 [Halorubrum sp. Eb13]OYR50689.1 hypothetical protein DJ73_15465 [Halorubrum sp. Ea1]OYR51856.1 hypothetical protein DJ74_02995 [Halorubrum sp. Ea8]
MTDTSPSAAAPDAQTEMHAADRDSTPEPDSVAVLHVEPDSRAAELFAAFTDRSVDGVTVRSVDGVAAAFDAADAVDCVVTEQRLPEGSGVELVRRLRRDGSDVPVLFHTTCREGETEALALEAGADGYFTKRSERGQYERLLERLRELVAGNGPRTAETAAPPSGPRPGAETAGSEE